MDVVVQTPVLAAPAATQTTPTATAESAVELMQGTPLFSNGFISTSALCEPDTAGNTFLSTCANGELTISQSASRRKVDIALIKETPFQADAFSMTLETESTPADAVRTDQNTYGLLFTDNSGYKHVLSISGQFFDYETWEVSADHGIKAIAKYNLTYAPSIKPASQVNHWRLDCSVSACEIYANNSLAGRIPAGINGKAISIGVFAKSGWDQLFGQVKFSNLQVFKLDDERTTDAPFSKEDPLKNESALFSESGLSGAFNTYAADGFHFSPVIPFGNYAVKGGPALADVALEVTVRMAVDPQASSSRYAGLVCRSSQEGMIMAVIRADGTYSVYRDTPGRPFALLAEKASNEIISGLNDNRLRLECIGSQINFFINGQQVESLADTRYGLRFGRAGLFTKAGNAPNPDSVIFSDFSISEIR